MKRKHRQRLAVSLTAAAVCAACVGAAAPATASTRESASTSSSSIPPSARVTTIEHPAYAPVRESVSTFLAKAARAGHPVPAAVSRELTVEPASVSCWYWDDWRRGKNIFGWTMWQFNVEPNWCGDGSWIRDYAYTNTWGSTPGPGWEYKGYYNSHTYGGVNWNIYESIRQGSFCYIDYYKCVQNSYPYINVEVGPRAQIYRS